MTFYSFITMQLTCIGFVLRQPFIFALWLLMFMIPWLSVIGLSFGYHFSFIGILEFFLFVCVTSLGIPLLSRYTTRLYFKKLGVAVNQAMAPMRTWAYLTLLHINMFIRAAYLKGYSVFFRPHQFLTVPVSIKENLSDRETLLARINILVDGLSSAQWTAWSSFFQWSALFNLSIITLFFGLMLIDGSWWIFSFVLSAAHIMTIYALYAILLYASMVRIALPQAPQVLQDFVNKM